jgi:predicted O-linked N-acetylglucosamine transferase (SPINDLY family)
MIEWLRRLGDARDRVLGKPPSCVVQVRAFMEGGRYPQARAILAVQLRQRPQNLELLQLSAELAMCTDDAAAAIEAYDRIVALFPDDALAWYKRGNLANRQGRLASALADYDRAVEIDPHNASAWCNRGVVLDRLGRVDEALRSLDRSHALAPDDALALFNRAAVLRRMQRRQEALSALTDAIQISPNLTEAKSNRSTLLTELGRYEEALHDIDEVLRTNPDFAPGYYNRAVIRQKIGSTDAAMADYRVAIELRSESPEAFTGRAALHAQIGDWRAAAADLARAVAIDARYAPAYYARGNMFLAQLQPEAALEDFGRALSLDPDYADAHLARARALSVLGQIAEAFLSFDRALKINPQVRFALGERCHARMQLCDWVSFEADIEAIKQGVQRGGALSPPFPMLTIAGEALLQRECTQRFVAEEYCAFMQSAAKPVSAAGASCKVRVGFVSGDFFEHPVARLLLPMVNSLDRDRFEVSAFSFGPDTGDPLRRLSEASFDQFFDLRRESPWDIADRIRKHGIDIAIDLGGHTATGRLQIFARRPAPIQVSYLGYAGTTACPFIDFLVADHVVVPAQWRAAYTEAVIYLPNCFVPGAQVVEHVTGVADRLSLGLPLNSVVYCCFNNCYKFTPAVFKEWMTLLLGVEGSVLWLAHANESVSGRLRQAARAHGVDPDRLIFAQRMGDHAAHVARYRAADLFLDTRPYNAHATALEALSIGLPVLTCPDQGFASRVGASLLTSLGMTELIADNPAHYLETALTLGRERGQLKEIREKLARQIRETTTFDVTVYARRFGRALEKALDLHRAGFPPRDIEIES